MPSYIPTVGSPNTGAAAPSRPPADQLAARVVVAGTQQRRHRHIDEIRVAIPGLAVSISELGAFGDDMDEIGADRVEAVEIEALQQGELLQENRALAPRAAFDDGVTAVVIGQRGLDRRLPARH